MPSREMSSEFADILFLKGSDAIKWHNEVVQAIDRKTFAALADEKTRVLFALGVRAFDKLKVDFATSMKNLGKAMELKDEGNKLYKEGKYSDAREAYTKSLMYYPVDWGNPSENKEYAIILANRSAALDAERRYEACARDIDMAFKYGYPRNLQFKIYHRRGHALLKLRQYESSKEAFTKCLDMIGKSDMPSKQRDQFRAKTKKQMTVFNVVKKLCNQPLDTKPRVHLANGSSDSSSGPELSAKTSVNEMGELEAMEDIKAGDGIFAESHLVAAVTDPSEEGKLCPHTLKRMDGPVPCQFGSDVTFPSEEVREQANTSYHQYEWKFIRALKNLGISPVALLALRLVTSLKPEDASKMTREPLEEASSVKRFHEAFQLPVSISMDSDNAVSASIVAGLFLKLLKESDYTSTLSESERDELASVLYRSIVIATEYGLPIKFLKSVRNREELFDGEKVEFPSSECAIGIFPRLAHLVRKVGTSDDPDLFCFYFNNQMALESIRNVPKGKAVSISLKSDISRPIGENDMITFRCSNELCSTGFPLKENTKEKLIRCPMETCNKETNIWLKLKRIQELKELYKQAREKLMKEDPSDGIKALKYLIQEWEKVIIRPYKDITKLEKDLKLALILKHVIERDNWIREHM